MKKREDLDLILVYYNSESIINYIYGNIISISKIVSRVIIIDNGSKDNTFIKLCALYEKNPNISVIQLNNNLHLGGAIKEGFKLSNSKFIAWSHGDTIIPPEFYNEALHHLKRFDNAYIKALRKNQLSINKIFTWLLGIYATIFIKAFLRDISGYPSMCNSDLKEKIIEYAPNDYSFDLFSYSIASKLKLKIIRIPVMQVMPNNNPSSWERSVSGYAKMIGLWLKNIRKVNSILKKMDSD